MTAHYPLPVVVNPPDRVYVCLGVPDERFHRMAFLGQLAQLANWFTWERDPAHTGRLAAQIWDGIFSDVVNQMAEGGGCSPMAIQYRMNVCGYIEFSIDGGLTWNVVADMSNCFIWKQPDSDTRNIIYPSGNFAALTLQARPGNTNPLFRVFDQSSNLKIYIGANGDVIDIYGSDITWFSFQELWFKALKNHWEGDHILRGSYGQKIDWQNGTGVISSEHPESDYNLKILAYSFLRMFADNGATEFKLGNRKAVLPASVLQSLLNDDVTLTARLKSGQTVWLKRHETALGALLSGVDTSGRFVQALTAGEPTDYPADGTMAFDPSEPALYVFADPSWVKIGQKGDPGDTGVPGPMFGYNVPRQRPNAGESDECDMVVLANGYTMLPWTIAEGDTLEITGAHGWWSDDKWTPEQLIVDRVTANLGYCADGSVYSTDTCEQTPSDPQETDPNPDEAHMCLLIAVPDGVGKPAYINAYDATLHIGFPDIDWSESYPYAWFFPNTPSLTGNSGGIKLHVKLTAAVPETCRPQAGLGFATFVSGNNYHAYSPVTPNETILGVDYYTVSVCIEKDAPLSGECSTCYQWSFSNDSGYTQPSMAVSWVEILGCGGQENIYDTTNPFSTGEGKCIYCFTARSLSAFSFDFSLVECP